MKIETKEVGEIFRKRREELEYSLKAVESATSIRQTHLQAIEEGNIETFLSTVYMYGFMRQYAHFLELDMEKIATEYPQAFQKAEESQEFAYGIGTLEKRHGKSSMDNLKWRNYALWSSAFLGTFLVAWWLSRALGLFS